MRFLVAFLCVLAVGAAVEQARFDNYRVYRITPHSDNQCGILKHMEELDSGFDFWTSVRGINQHVDVMVPPHKLADFQELLARFGLDYDILMLNLQDVVDEERTTSRSTYEFNFIAYHRLSVINQHLESLAQKYSEVSVVVGGRSYEGRDITGVKLSYGSGSKPVIFIEAGIHAREWISPATVLFMLNELLTSSDSEVRRIAQSYDWYIFPSTNPDGYEYTHTSNRMWRKTRKPYGLCAGADPNRNWDAHWMEIGASNNPCSETFAGSSAFSEIETKSLSEYIAGLGGKIKYYLGFHSYSQYLLIPYGHTTEHLDNYEQLMRIGRKTIQSLATRYGTKYVVGSIPEVIYFAAGGSMDWVKQEFQTPITYTYELRDTGRYGFLLPPNQIIPTGEETFDSLITMIQEGEKEGIN